MFSKNPQQFVEDFLLYLKILNFKSLSTMKKTLIIILHLIFFSNFSYSSITNTFVENNDTIYEEVDVFPQFENGMEALSKYVQDNLNYPQQAIDKNETARVFVEFVIDKSGQIRDAKLKREEKEYFKEAALKVITEMPKWKPGLKNGKYVNTRVVLPIIFER